MLPVVVPLNYNVTIAATDPSGNTSELSGGATVTGTDSVHDGLTDAWRKLHFGGAGTTTNALSCATCDPDHDGYNNMQEFFAGTDPNSAASLLSVAAAQGGGGVTISFPTVAGVHYQVDERSDLSSSGWSVLVDQVAGTGGVVQVTDPAGSVLTQGFYRVAAIP